MQIGPVEYRWVSTDTAGVPHGGRYGDIDWAESELEKVHLHLAWSQIWHSFVVYSQPRHDRFVCQDWCMTGGGHSIIPLTPDYLWLLMYFWRHGARQTKQTVREALNASQRKYDEELEKERQTCMADMKADVMKEWKIRTGRKSPAIWSFPKEIKVPELAL